MYGVIGQFELNYNQFIEQVVKNTQVWGLKSDNQWITKQSIGSFYDDNDNLLTLEIVPFWSNKNSAINASKIYWENAHIELITLEDFLENICLECHDKSLLMGINLNSQLVGKEIASLELIFDILEEIKLNEKILFNPKETISLN